MTSRKVSIIGGGPAGLFAGRLLARDHPDWQVTVFERLPPLETFGFGVGLTPGVLREVKKADPAVHDDLVGASFEFSSAWFDLPEGIAELPNSHAGAISRATLLQLLLARAEEVGVDVRIGETATLDSAREGTDLVIAADGVASATRQALAPELGVRDELGRGRFIWCGAEAQLSGTLFAPAHTEHGTFVVHTYPFAADRTTLVIETDEGSLERAGCVTTEFAGDGDSDEAALDYLSTAFSELLGGRRLLGNRSRWMRFRTISCATRVHGEVVLLGDAAATAHPSLGSGTKLALEDAIALAACLRDIGDAPLTEGLRAFDRTRPPAVRRLQQRARRSQLWWESFPSRLDLSPARIAVAYLSRAGAVSLSKTHVVAPELASAAVADWAGTSPDEVPGQDLAEWVLHRPLDVDGLRIPARLLDRDGALSLEGEPVAVLEVACDDAWSAAAADALAQARARLDGGARIIHLVGEPSRDALLDRLTFGERIRRELGGLVAVDCSRDHLDDAVDGLVAGRTDLVVLSEESSIPATAVAAG
jgi:anthraniloyl-CoA monooxygenase